MKERENQVKDSAVNVKNYFIEMPKKKKIIFGAIALAIVLAAVILTITLNGKKEPTYADYQILYTMESPEAAKDLFLELKGLGADPIMEGNNILVKSSEYNVWMLAVNKEEAPKGAFAYGIFSQYAGLTSTESDRRQAIIFDLQDRLQGTLTSIKGVRDAIVTLNMAEESKNVWDKANNDSKTTASVTITMYSGEETLTSAQVTAIKNLVSSSVPKLAPSDVHVIDAGTSLELYGSTDDGADGLSSSIRIQLQRDMERYYEEKAISIMEFMIGEGRVAARANVELDFDKMISESYELQDRDGVGFVNSKTNSAVINGQIGIGGVVGEEDNTDIPQYPYGEPTEEGGVTSATNSIDYVYGYIKRQVEKGAAAVTSASISVAVDTDMDAVAQQNYMGLVSNSTGIPQTEIVIVNKNTPPVVPVVPDEEVPDEEVPPVSPIQPWVWFVIGGALLLVIALIIVLLIIKKKNKKIVEQKDAEIVDNMQSMEDEIAKYKRELENAARASTDPKDDAIMDEVRSFAKENPEITANLLRSWLKEGEE